MFGHLLLLASVLSPAEEYAARAGRIQQGDVKGWLSLADFCEEKGLFEKRAETLRKAVEADPDGPAAHGRLDEKKAGGKWLPALEADAEEERLRTEEGKSFYGKGWVSRSEAAKTAASDSKAAGFPVRVRIDTPRYSLYSGQDYPITRRFADILENAADAYQAFYGGVWKLDAKPKPLKVYFLPSREEFCRILTPLTGPPPPSARGCYLPSTKILYVSALENLSPELTQICAVHESIHSLDEAMAHKPGLPPWLSEGRADHLAFAILGCQVIPGVLRISPESDRVNQLRQARDIPLKTLCKLSQMAFESESLPRHQVLSWALVSYLFHGEEGRHAAGFRKFLSAGKAFGGEELAQALGTSLPKLEASFKDYLDKEFIPAVEARRPPAP